MKAGGGGGIGICVSRPANSLTTRLRSTRYGLLGYFGPNSVVVAVELPVALTIRRLYSLCACASVEATRRVPTHTPAAPRSRAFTTASPSAMPPDARSEERRVGKEGI